MSEIKRGAVLLIQSGDPEISGAIAEGILEARREATAAAGTSSGPAGHLPQRGRQEGTGEGMTEAQRRELARLVKVAIGNTKTPEDYLILCMAAEQEYCMPRRSELGRAAERLLTAWAMICYRVREYFRWEGSRWRGN